MAKPTKTDTEWQQELSPDEYRITRQKGTEPAFTGAYWKTTGEQGTYLCRCCKQPLFNADSKYDSGSGWPSFYQPLQRDAVQENADSSLHMQRVEVICSACQAHLGHVFPDGPEPTGLRYCINSASLSFKEEPETGS